MPTASKKPAPAATRIVLTLVSGEVLNLEDLIARAIAWGRLAERQGLAADARPPELEIVGALLDAGTY